MTPAERRLATIEASLTPREAVVRWLAEAQAYPSLVDYARSIVDLPDTDAPLSRLGREVETAVRAAMKGQPRQAVESAVRRAVGDAVFLFVLVIGLNQAALDTARLEGLRAAAVTFWMGALLGGPRSDEPTYVAELDAAWRHRRATLDALATTVCVESAARELLEQRYLAGHSSLFDDATETWANLEDQIDRLVGLAQLLPPTLGATASWRAPDVGPEDAGGDAVEARARWLADDARVRTFEMLNERPRAVAIMERRLRTKPGA